MIRSIINFSVCISMQIMHACNTPVTNDTENNKATEDITDHSAHKPMMGQRNSYADSVNSGLIAKDTLKGSPRRAAMATVNKCHVHIDYGSPGVKGRMIWGGLVAYDEVWVAGAHMATNISFNKPLEIDNKVIEAGTYGLFMIPAKDSWTVILNTRYEQHLADDYSEAEDVIRILVEPTDSDMVQRLTYKVMAKDEHSGSINFTWEKMSLDLPFVVKD